MVYQKKTVSDEPKEDSVKSAEQPQSAQPEESKKARAPKKQQAEPSAAAGSDADSKLAAALAELKQMKAEIQRESKARKQAERQAQ